MRKILTATLILILSSNFSFSQTKKEIDSLLNQISTIENSRKIIDNKSAQKIIVYDWKILPNLADFFTNDNPTNIYSDCLERNLLKGEIAIIIADRIKRMPYAKLTGVDNCLMIFCEDNSNLIEYYLPFIKENGIENFQEDYKEWLSSNNKIQTD